MPRPASNAVLLKRRNAQFMSEGKVISPALGAPSDTAHAGLAVTSRASVLGGIAKNTGGVQRAEARRSLSLTPRLRRTLHKARRLLA